MKLLQLASLPLSNILKEHYHCPLVPSFIVCLISLINILTCSKAGFGDGRYSRALGKQFLHGLPASSPNSVFDFKELLSFYTTIELVRIFYKLRFVYPSPECLLFFSYSRNFASNFVVLYSDHQPPYFLTSFAFLERAEYSRRRIFVVNIRPPPLMPTEKAEGVHIVLQNFINSSKCLYPISPHSCVSSTSNNLFSEACLYHASQYLLRSNAPAIV